MTQVNGRSEDEIRRDIAELQPYPPAQPWEWWSVRAERLLADVPVLLGRVQELTEERDTLKALTERDQRWASEQELVAEREARQAAEAQLENALGALGEVSAARQALQEAIEKVAGIAIELMREREFISNGHRVSDYGHDIAAALAAAGVPTGDPMSDYEQMVLLTEVCTERHCGTRVRYSELTDDANTHWHVKRGVSLVPVSSLPELARVREQIAADIAGKIVHIHSGSNPADGCPDGCGWLAFAANVALSSPSAVTPDEPPRGKCICDRALEGAAFHSRDCEAAMAAAVPALPEDGNRPDDELRRDANEYADLHRRMGLDEQPQRCPHGKTEPHSYPVEDHLLDDRGPVLVRCPGPSGTATPEGER